MGMCPCILIDQEIYEGKVTNLCQAETKSRPSDKKNHLHLQINCLLHNSIVLLLVLNLLRILQIVLGKAVS